MAVVLADLKTYVGSTESDYDAMLDDCLLEAQALVDKFAKKYDETTATYVAASVPASILDRCYLLVAADLFSRRNAPNGVLNQQFENFGGDQGAVVRLARDPMQAAYKLLARWVTPW